MQRDHGACSARARELPSPWAPRCQVRTLWGANGKIGHFHDPTVSSLQRPERILLGPILGFSKKEVAKAAKGLRKSYGTREGQDLGT